ncbi:MAG: alpha/beta hydrolase fold domain-containing protein [Bacilli bacterium]|nr:alpha/beta hydrolase fold domain-containing protein [Bacilli bacterium]
MKFGAFAVSLLVKSQNKAEEKRRKLFQEDVDAEKKLDIPYIDDGNDYHKIDVFLVKKNRNNIAIVDIHGGSYIFGSRRNNHYFASKFVAKGFDFICVDYIPNTSERGTDSLLKDVASSLGFIASSKEKLGLGEDQFVLLGDSAGGHVALFMQELCENKTVEAKVGFGVNGFSSYAVALNCTVYDYKEIVKPKNLRRSGRKRMFGPGFDNEEHLEKYSPRTWINEVKAPIFASTCTRDFLRLQTLTLKEDLTGLGKEDFEILDIESKDRSISHVHNLILPDAEESRFNCSRRSECNHFYFRLHI